MSAESPVCKFGWKAPDFTLLGTDGEMHTRQSVQGPKGLLIMFLCNHCPYVHAILAPLVHKVVQMKKMGIGVAAICANDAEAYPEDSFAEMRIMADLFSFAFPYLHDEAQEVARAYDAVCTPDFFGFNADLSLQYRGRYDASRRQRTAETPCELYEAMCAIAKTNEGPRQQYPSIGCSIKWKS